MNPREVVEAWLAAWNSDDLEGIIALYAEDAVTESPLLLRMGRDGSATLRGKGAIRDYFARGLAHASVPIVMTPIHLLASGEVAILEYAREAPNGGHPAVAERFVVRDGKIVESRIFWNADKIQQTFGIKAGAS